MPIARIRFHLPFKNAAAAAATASGTSAVTAGTAAAGVENGAAGGDSAELAAKEPAAAAEPPPTNAPPPPDQQQAQLWTQDFEKLLEDPLGLRAFAVSLSTTSLRRRSKRLSVTFVHRLETESIVEN